MSIILLGIPLAAVLAIILLSIGLRPARVFAVWLALVVLSSATSLLVGGDDAPPPDSTAAATAPPPGPGGQG